MSENYQSRVFTFVNRSANQLKDTCAKGLRHIKIAVVWSSQILLYPLHLLAQATKILQPQLPPPPHQPKLPQPVSDINIEQALELVESAGYPIEICRSRALTIPGDDLALVQTGSLRFDERSSLDSLPQTANGNIAIRDREVATTKPIIRGLSSLLSDRSLVLVTTTNETLNILTISQQQEIRRRIGLDLAIAWHTWHPTKLSGDLDAKQLSGDRQLSLTAQPNLARRQTTRELRATPRQNLLDRLRSWFNKNNLPESKIAIDGQQLLPAATSTSPAQLPPHQYPFNPQPLKLEQFLDLPQLPPIAETDRTVDRDNALGEIIAKFQPNWLKQLWNYYRDYVHIPAPTGDEILYQPPQEFKLIPIDPKPSNIVVERAERDETQSERRKSSRQLRASANLVKKASQNLEYQPDWIEAISEEIGYSQSPFARFLAWLDRLVLAIENWLIEIWQKIVNRRSPN